MCRYYCDIRVDMNHKGAFEHIQDLNEKIEVVLENWSNKMMEDGILTDIGWRWSEHKNV